MKKWLWVLCCGFPLLTVSGQTTGDTLRQMFDRVQGTSESRRMVLEYTVYPGPTVTEPLDAIELEVMRSGLRVYVRMGNSVENYYDGKEQLMIDHENQILWLERRSTASPDLPMPEWGSWTGGIDSLIRQGSVRRTTTLPNEATVRMTLEAEEHPLFRRMEFEWDARTLVPRRWVFQTSGPTVLLRGHTSEPIRVEIRFLHLTDAADLPDRTRVLTLQNNRYVPTPAYAGYRFTNLMP